MRDSPWYNHNIYLYIYIIHIDIWEFFWSFWHLCFFTSPILKRVSQQSQKFSGLEWTPPQCSRGPGRQSSPGWDAKYFGSLNRLRMTYAWKRLLSIEVIVLKTVRRNHDASGSSEPLWYMASECLEHVQSGDVSWGVVPGFQESLEINLHRPPSLFHSRHAPAQCSLHISY